MGTSSMILAAWRGTKRSLVVRCFEEARQVDPKHCEVLIGRINRCSRTMRMVTWGNRGVEPKHQDMLRSDSPFIRLYWYHELLPLARIYPGDFIQKLQGRLEQ